MNNVMIQTENLKKSYSSGAVATDALRGVDLVIERGSFTCIIGPSGHGKSTLLHLIGALDRPSSGRVVIGGRDAGGLSAGNLASLRAEKIGFVFQFFNLLPTLTVKENIETAMMFHGKPESVQSARARELLELVGLGDKADSRPFQLSGGQQQRVAVARALANDPELLLMDEPTGNLDSVSEAEVLEVIHAMHRQGKTIVMVTHNNEIASRAERVIRVKDGRIQDTEVGAVKKS